MVFPAQDSDHCSTMAFHNVGGHFPQRAPQTQDAGQLQLGDNIGQQHARADLIEVSMKGAVYPLFVCFR